MPTNPAPRSAPISAASPQRSSAAAAPAQREPLPEPPEPSYEYSGGPRYRSVRRHPSPTAQTKAAESRSPSRRQDAHQLTFTSPPQIGCFRRLQCPPQVGISAPESLEGNHALISTRSWCRRLGGAALSFKTSAAWYCPELLTIESEIWSCPHRP